jgi:GNAT superfamily N-acetyltransferase
MQEFEIRPLTKANMSDLERLFSSEKAANSCWCMWFIVRVKDYHTGGAAGNKAKLKELAATSTKPLGVIAYHGGEPVGWAAAGPRSRYKRAVATPTLKSIDQSENDTVWLVPCFFIHPDMRGQRIAGNLLKEAVALARSHGALAIEGFPTAKKGSADRQVGTEPLFAAHGFRAVSRPSSNRAVMRLDLADS